MRRTLSCAILAGLFLAPGALPTSSGAGAQTAPELECVWKGTCPRPAPRPTPPVVQPAPKPAPPAPTPPRDTVSPTPPPAPTPPKDDTVGPAPTPKPADTTTTQPPAPPPGPPPMPAAVASRLRELAQGDPQDVLLFFNETQDAPNGARSPQGQVNFRDGRVAPCAALGWTGGPDVTAATRAVLERHGATRIVTDVAATSCPEGRRPYDIIAVERRMLQALPPEAARSLLTDIAERRLTPLATVTAADIAAARDRLRREREIAAGLRDGSLQGMGLLLLGGNARRVCAAGVDDDQQPAVAAAIQVWRASLPPHLAAGGVDIASFDKSGALAAAQRGECGAIFGDAATLRDIDAALRSASMPAMPAGVWLTPQEWDALLERSDVPRNTAERRRMLAAKVNPLAEKLVADLQAYVAAGGKSGTIGSEFAAFAKWYGQLRTATWTPSVQQFDIDDYGEAADSGGKLPAVSVVVYFGLSAPNAPESRRDCMIFAWLDDAGLRRESLAFRCDALSDLERWKRQRGMKSKWS